MKVKIYSGPHEGQEVNIDKRTLEDRSYKSNCIFNMPTTIGPVEYFKLGHKKVSPYAMIDDSAPPRATLFRVQYCIIQGAAFFDGYHPHDWRQ